MRLLSNIEIQQTSGGMVEGVIAGLVTGLLVHGYYYFEIRRNKNAITEGLNELENLMGYRNICVAQLQHYEARFGYLPIKK